jgi:uncharacterized protein YndB with AHSA1/START domain
MPYSTSATTSINAPAEQVWQALTRPELVKKYFFNTDLVTDWKVGSPLFFRGEWDGKAYEDRGTVLSFEPMRSFSYNYWSSFSGFPDEPARRQIIRYELEPGDDGIHVAVHQSNVDTQERADHSGKNWRAVLEACKTFVEGTARSA